MEPTNVYQNIKKTPHDKYSMEGDHMNKIGTTSFPTSNDDTSPNCIDSHTANVRSDSTFQDKSISQAKEMRQGKHENTNNSKRINITKLESDLEAKERASLKVEDLVSAKIRIRSDSTRSQTPITSYMKPNVADNSELIDLDELINAKLKFSGKLDNLQSRSSHSRSNVDYAISAKMAGRNLAKGISEETFETGATMMTYLDDDYESPKSFGGNYEAKNSVKIESKVNPKDKSGDKNLSSNKDFTKQDLEYNIYGTDIDTGLAVATAVGDDDELFIPAAVEFDPDAKPPLYKNRRFRLYSAVACVFLVIVVVVISVVIVLGQGDSGSSDITNEMQPSLPYRETLGILETVTREIGAEYLNNTESPYSQALQWITYEDPFQIVPEDSSFLQRYVLAYFYYATSVDRPWLSCSQADGNETDDCMFIKAVDSEGLEKSEIPFKRWLSNSSECKWAGVFCNDNLQVTSIEMPGTNMTGSIPEGLKHLTFLQSLNMAFGELTGTIPASIAELKHLISLELQLNMIEGTIPSELWTARSIQRLNLAMNEITGTIPTAISGDLKGIFIFNNRLNGTIPIELGEVSALGYLRAQQNMFSGPIPDSFGLKSQLLELMLHKNQLTGQLPDSLGKLSAIEDLRLSDNQFTGEIPSSIYELSTINRLDLYDNNFNGTISTNIGQLTTLTVFRVRNNRLSGTIPSELGQLKGLAELWLSGNRFDGSILNSICELRANETVGLMELEADCWASNITGLIANPCLDNCCTECCDPDWGICFEMTEELN